jgi:hypothetical protein
VARPQQIKREVEEIKEVTEPTALKGRAVIVFDTAAPRGGGP